MSSNSTSKMVQLAGRFGSHSRALSALISLIIVLAACSGSTPPGPNSVSGVAGQASYLLIDWEEGLRILIWDDIPYGGHGSASSSSTSDPPFHQEGSAQSADGRSYEYSLETIDGQQADFTIDGIPYDLKQGNLFLIRTTGGATQVEQLDIDLTSLSPTNAGIEDFGRKVPQIAVLMAGSGLVTPTPSTTGMQGPTPTAWDADLRTASALDASPEEVTRFFAEITDEGGKDLPPELDPVIAAVLSNNLEARRALVRFTTAGCTHELGKGGPPKCAADQTEGTPVEYFPVLGPGEGEHIHPESIDRMLDFDTEALYAVYRRTDQSVSDQYFPSGAFGLIFTNSQQESITTYILVHVDEGGKIVRLDYVAWPLESIIERESGEYLVLPEEFQPENAQINSTPTAEASIHPLAGLVYRMDDGLWIVDRQGQSRLIIDQPSAHLSPDGRYVVFQPEYDPDIWLADLVTDERRNLTESSGRFHTEPQWWPGKQDVIISGSSEELGPGFGYPTIARTDGSDYRILDQEAGGPLALSPDGQMLAYGGFDQAGKIYHWDGVTEVFDPADYALAVEKIFQPAWSPDGRQLAWKVSANPDNSGWSLGIAVFDLETKTAKLFHTYTPVGGGTVPHYLAWSPSDDWLAFVTFNERAEDGRLPNLWIAQPDGQGETRIGTAVDPVWSPTGRQLAYSLVDDTQSANVVWIYDIQSGEQRQVLPAGSRVVDWLPPAATLFQHLMP
jgi:Tol biopolymer transport system component